MSEKVWFITGASRGFGRIWAEGALARGDKVVATARSVDSLSGLAKKYGDAVLPLALDVTKREQVQAVIPKAHAHFGRLACPWSAPPSPSGWPCGKPGRPHRTPPKASLASRPSISCKPDACSPEGGCGEVAARRCWPFSAISASGVVYYAAIREEVW